MEDNTGVHCPEFISFLYVWAFCKIKTSGIPPTKNVIPCTSQTRVMEATSSHPGVFQATSSRSSVGTSMSNFSQARMFPCEVFCVQEERAKKSMFFWSCRWEQKPLGTLPCTAVLSSVKAPQQMSACIWLCGWQSSSAIQPTCSWYYGNEFVSMFMAGRWVINPSWRTDFNHRSD